jgi:hypothetical protein
MRKRRRGSEYRVDKNARETQKESLVGRNANKRIEKAKMKEG